MMDMPRGLENPHQHAAQKGWLSHYKPFVIVLWMHKSWKLDKPTSLLKDCISSTQTCFMYCKSHQQVWLTLQYTLESFVEKRKAGYEYKPYKGGEIDDPSQGRAPEAWEMEVKFKELFKKQDEKLEVPHTSTVRVSRARIKVNMPDPIRVRSGLAGKRWPEAGQMTHAHWLVSRPDPFGPNLAQSARTKSDLGWFCTILCGTSMEERNRV